MAEVEVTSFEGCDVKHDEVKIEGGSLHYAHCGPEDGPLILLLHGFPSYWLCWRTQMPFFASKGFHTVALDMRGYHTSFRPEGLSHYSRAAIVGDVASAITHLTGRKEGDAGDGEKRTDVTLVGHDWGGVVAWEAAHDFPALIDRLVIINAPHGDTYQKKLTFSQMYKSYYIGIFQLPYIGEYFISRENFRAIKYIIGKTPKKPPPREDVDRHVAVFSQPGALTAAINYYRAIVWGYWPAKERKNKAVEFPALVLWGDQDPHLESALADPPSKVTKATVKHFPEGSHWLQWDEAEGVNNEILDFVNSSKSA